MWLKTKINPTKHIKEIHRKMTSGKSVLDRGPNKRVHSLEIVTENWKIFSKIHFLMETIHSQPEHVMPISAISPFRRQINLPKPFKISDFLKKSPALFDFYRDHDRVTWVGLTDRAEDLLAEEQHLIDLYSGKLAEFVARFLMMCVDRRLSLNKLAHFRRDFGLPADFRKNWVYKFPELFKVVKMKGDNDEEETEYLELVEWRDEWAVTELEKRVLKLCGEDEGERVFSPPGMLALAFPLKFPPFFKGVYKLRRKLEDFQRLEYLSPYADARGLVPGSVGFDKRAMAIMHELLSFTLEKRIVTDHFTHFRKEMAMPQKLMRLLLRHCGVFYVSEKGQRYHVFLNEAYDGTELIDKCPLVAWREKVHRFIGYRDKSKKRARFDEFIDVEDKSSWKDDSEVELEEENTDCVLGEDDLIVDGDGDEMDVDEVFREYTEDG